MSEQNMNYEVETNFKEVLKSNFRYFGIFYLIVIIGGVITGVHFIRNNHILQEIKYRNMSLPVVHDSTDKPMKKASVMEGVNVAEISVSSPELIEKGKAVFAANCASCHGENGMGDGAAGQALNPKPRNFHQADGWTNGRKITEIYKTLEEGILQNGMAAYEYLPVSDRFALIHLIRSWSKDAPANTTEELSELDLTYKLSEGKATTNQIPVAKAKELIAKESENKKNELKSVVNYLNSSNNFNRVTSDKNKAVALLMNSNIWKNDLNTFIRIVNSNIPNNGFNSNFSKMDRASLSELFELLKQSIASKPIEEIVVNE